MTVKDIPGVRIAEPTRRTGMIVLVIMFGALLLLIVVPATSKNLHALAASLAFVAAGVFWAMMRAWRMGLRLDSRGVTVRNFFGSYRIGLHEVSRFADGTVWARGFGPIWGLDMVLRDGRVIQAKATVGRQDASLGLVTSIAQAAARYGIPADLTGQSPDRPLL
jgi:hypothetical protein